MYIKREKGGETRGSSEEGQRREGGGDLDTGTNKFRSN